MRVQLEIDKSVEENAENYFEKAKKMRQKQQGAKEAIKHTKALLARAENAAEKAQRAAELEDPEKRWYHKYHWSYTRNGHVVVAGQNADANETLVKHHAEKDDLVLHTDMRGSPFAILKPSGDVQEEDLEDAATIVACYSKAWKGGIASVEVFHVRPDQVTKEAEHGEYLEKGSFMIRGDTTYHHPDVRLGLGVISREGVKPEVFAGSPEACEEHCAGYAVLVPGGEKTSDVAKKLRKRFGGDLDAYIKAIPAGGSTITAWHK